MKKKISVLLVCAMLFSICTVNGFALGLDGSSDTYEELPISAEQGQEILSEFSAEISYAEEAYGLSITKLDRETFETLKVIAIQNLHNEDYNFPGLIDTVVITCEQNRLQDVPKVVSKDGSVARSIDTVETVRAYGLLCGQHYTPVPVGVDYSETREAQVVISVGTKVGAQGIIEDGISVSGQSTVTLTKEFKMALECTVHGPTENTKLYNGMYATDRIYFEILYGTVVKITHEYPISGLITIDYKISQDSIRTVPKTILASTGVPAYADNIQRTKTFPFADLFAIFDKIRYYPESFLAL